MSGAAFAKPLLIVVSGPSGAGKSTLCNKLLAEFPALRFSVSCTTREPRGTEKDGEAYHFLSRAEFERRIAADDFLEFAEVHGNLYGTLKSETGAQLERGRSVLLDIDVAGAAQVRGIVATLPRASLMRGGFIDIFIAPPSIDELRRRLEKRGEDAPHVVAKRLENAATEIARAAEFSHVLTNHDADASYEMLKQMLMERSGEGCENDCGEGCEK